MNDVRNEESVIAEFRSRKKRQIIALIPAIFALLFMLGMENPEFNFFNLSQTVLGSVAIIIMVLLIIFALYNWRCPACNKYLGKGFNPGFCPNCGAKLK